MLKVILTWLRGVLVDIIAMKASAPKYTATTRAKSTASPEQKTAVKNLIKNSELWIRTRGEKGSSGSASRP